MRKEACLAVCALVALLSCPHPGNAQEPIVVERGTRGLSPVPFRAANHTGDPIECDVATAHWYSAPIGRADPGGTVSGELWSDPSTGVLSILNEKADRMPIQEAWCGFAGAAVSTRADIRFTRRAGEAEPSVTLTCTGRTSAGKLDCRRDEVR